MPNFLPRLNLFCPTACLPEPSPDFLPKFDVMKAVLRKAIVCPREPIIEDLVRLDSTHFIKLLSTFCDLQMFFKNDVNMSLHDRCVGDLS